jgi:branched-chain amino acid transport system permease protein
MLTALVTGFAIGSVYGATALLFNVTFSTSKVLSLTTGHLVMLGAVMGSWLTGVHGYPSLLAFVGVLCIGGLFGWLTDLLAIRRVIHSIDPHLSLLSTLAVATMVQQAVGLWWGTEPRPFPRILTTEFGGIYDEKFWMPVAAVVILGMGLAVFYRFTIYGKLFIATSEDSFAARARGINTDRIRTMSFVIAGIMGTAVGFAAGQLTYAYFAIGNLMLIYGFIALAVGGIGSNIGGVIGGWLTGLVSAVATYWFGGEYEKTIALGILILALLVRPQGIFGDGSRRTV